MLFILADRHNLALRGLELLYFPLSLSLSECGGVHPADCNPAFHLPEEIRARRSEGGLAG